MTIQLAGEDLKVDSKTAIKQIQEWIENRLVAMR